MDRRLTLNNDWIMELVAVEIEVRVEQRHALRLAFVRAAGRGRRAGRAARAGGSAGRVLCACEQRAEQVGHLEPRLVRGALERAQAEQRERLHFGAPHERARAQQRQAALHTRTQRSITVIFIFIAEHKYRGI